jgi:hypothetical protein
MTLQFSQHKPNNHDKQLLYPNLDNYQLVDVSNRTPYYFLNIIKPPYINKQPCRVEAGYQRPQAAALGQQYAASIHLLLPLDNRGDDDGGTM